MIKFSKFYFIIFLFMFYTYILYLSALSSINNSLIWDYREVSLQNHFSTNQICNVAAREIIFHRTRNSSVQELNVKKFIAYPYFVIRGEDFCIKRLIYIKFHSLNAVPSCVSEWESLSETEASFCVMGIKQ